MELKDTQYFKSWEIIYSYVAEQNNIDNTPTDEEIIENINYTLERLNTIRENYGKPIIITSGYRCDMLNSLVGGVKDSYHKKGLAADLEWDIDLAKHIIDNEQFDSFIREINGNTKWLHIQFRRNRDEERQKVRSINVKKG